MFYDTLSLFEAQHTFRIQQDNAVTMTAVDRTGISMSPVTRLAKSKHAISYSVLAS
jgi:hypothetical protein